jgi:hypothetical protein
MGCLRFRNVVEEGLHSGVPAAVREIRFGQRVDDLDVDLLRPVRAYQSTAEARRVVSISSGASEKLMWLPPPD